MMYSLGGKAKKSPGGIKIQIAMVNPRKPKRKAKRVKATATKRQAYMSKTMKSLIGRGMSPQSAMATAAMRFRKSEEENAGTRQGSVKGWRRRKTVKLHGYAQPIGAKYPRWREEENPRRRRKKGKGKRKYKTITHKTRRHKARKAKSKHSYFRPSKRRARIGGYVFVPKGTEAEANPKRRRKHYKHKRKNPETAMIPTFGRIKGQIFSLPSKHDFYPTFAEIKAHPVVTILGMGVGLISTAAFGGMGRVLGGKNVLMSEVLGVVGNVVGFELPARIVSLFNFGGKTVMARSIRLSGIIVTGISLLFGLIRIFTSVKKDGVKGLGALEMPKFKDLIPAVISNPIKTALTGVGGVGFADVVTSGKASGYTGQEPMGVSGGQDPYLGMGETVFPPGITDTPLYADTNLGDPTLVSKIQNLARDLGLGADELQAMSQRVTAPRNLGGDSLGDSVVPATYQGGMAKDFVI